MTKDQIHRTFSLYLLPGILFGCTYLAFGFHYQSSDDALVSALIRGFPFGVPVAEFYFCHRITAIAYARLGQAFPKAPWYEMAMYTLLFLSIRNYFALIYDRVKKLLPIAALIPILIGAYVVFFLNSVIFINFTEVSIFLSSSALLLALVRVIGARSANLPVPLWPTLGCLALFTLGFLTRPQGGLLSLLVLGPFALIHGWRLFWNCVRYVYVPALAVIVVLQIYDRITWTDGSAYYRSVSGYVFNILDAQTDTTAPVGEIDAMRYEAIRQWFLGDRQTTTVDLLSRVAPSGVIDLRKLKVETLKNKLGEMYLLSSKYQLVIALMVPVLSVLAVANRFGKDLGWRLLGLTVLYWMPILTVAIFWKMPPRVLTPSIIMYVLASVVLALISLASSHVGGFPLRRNINSFALTAVWVAVVILILGAGRQKTLVAESVGLQMAENSRLRDAIQQKCADGTIVFTMDAMNAFIKYEPMANHSMHCTSMLIDSSWATLLPQYPQHLKNLTGSDAMPDVFDYLGKKKEKVIFVSTDKRNKFIEGYLAKVYQKQYTFDPIEFRPSSIELEQVGLFVIR